MHVNKTPAPLFFFGGRGAKGGAASLMSCWGGGVGGVHHIVLEQCELSLLFVINLLVPGRFFFFPSSSS